jgi:hypothetical protein
LQATSKSAIAAHFIKSLRKSNIIEAWPSVAWW